MGTTKIFSGLTTSDKPTSLLYVMLIARYGDLRAAAEASGVARRTLDAARHNATQLGAQSMSRLAIALNFPVKKMHILQMPWESGYLIAMLQNTHTMLASKELIEKVFGKGAWAKLQEMVDDEIVRNSI